MEPVEVEDRDVRSYMHDKQQQFLGAKELVIKEKLRAQQEQLAREERMQKHRHVYAKGDIVYYYAPRLTELQTNTRKFQAQWIGPLQIKQIVDPTHVILADLEGKELGFLATVHINLIKPCLIFLGETKKNKLITYDHTDQLKQLKAGNPVLPGRAI